MRALVGLVLCVACAACHEQGAVADPCAQALDHAASIAVAAIPAGASPQMAQGLRAAIATNARDGTAHCQADHWPLRATTCLAQAATSDEVTACFQWLTPAQRAAMEPTGRAPGAGAPGSGAP